ncbi:MAG TPA: hypothetical protein IAA11_08800 [Candidatus Blautia intestinigallinarum]|nr:hypothetical protein [Candidatus Blautia intestinigallinarum]
MDMEKGTITDIFVYEHRGASPRPVTSCQATVQDGLADDWHGQDVDRQISILSEEAREQKEGFCLKKFKENIRTRGMDLAQVKPGDQLKTSQVTFEITGVFKKCYPDLCPLAQSGKPCLLRDHALFARVSKGGTLHAGDDISREPASK